MISGAAHDSPARPYRIVDAITSYYHPNGTTYLLAMFRSAIDDAPEQHESLINNHHIRDSGIVLDDHLACHGGTQSFTVSDIQFDLDYANGAILQLQIHWPTDFDRDNGTLVVLHDRDCHIRHLPVLRSDPCWVFAHILDEKFPHGRSHHRCRYRSKATETSLSAGSGKKSRRKTGKSTDEKSRRGRISSSGRPRQLSRPPSQSNNRGPIAVLPISTVPPNRSNLPRRNSERVNTRSTEGGALFTYFSADQSRGGPSSQKRDEVSSEATDITSMNSSMSGRDKSSQEKGAKDQFYEWTQQRSFRQDALVSAINKEKCDRQKQTQRVVVPDTDSPQPLNGQSGKCKNKQCHFPSRRFFARTVSKMVTRKNDTGEKKIVFPRRSNSSRHSEDRSNDYDAKALPSRRRLESNPLGLLDRLTLKSSIMDGVRAEENINKTSQL